MHPSAAGSYEGGSAKLASTSIFTHLRLFVALLRQLVETKVNEFMFPGRPGRPLSNGALLVLLKRMNRSDLTAHGFRSSFRDWVAEQTNFPRDVAEMALSHAIRDKVEAAYRRGDLLEKRRRMMEVWATYASTTPVAGKVVVSMRLKL